MAEEKMTQKQMYALIAETMRDNAEIVEFCEKNIERLSRPRKKKVDAAFEELAEVVLAHVAKDPTAVYTNKELVEWYNDSHDEDDRISSQKMAAIMRYLVGKEQVKKIVGEKASDVTKYTLA